MTYQKCECKQNGYLETACNALQQAVELHPTKRSKGLYAQSRVRLSDNQSLGTVLLLKSGDFIDNGIGLNYCPFCGNKVRDLKNEVVKRDYEVMKALYETDLENRDKAISELLEFVEEVRRTGDTRLANMAIAVIAKTKGEE